MFKSNKYVKLSKQEKDDKFSKLWPSTQPVKQEKELLEDKKGEEKELEYIPQRTE